MYEYGCRKEPIAGLDAALDQMERRVQLWNRFVAIEREIRRRARSLLIDEGEQRGIRELRIKIASFRTSILERRKTNGQNAIAIEDLRKLIVASQNELAALLARAKLNRRQRFMRSRTALNQLQEERAGQVKQAQRDSKLYWCNYDDVRHAYEVARVRVMKEGTELREHPWNDSGRVSVRFQRGLPVRTAFTRRGLRLQIDPVSDEAWTSPVRSVRRNLSRSKVRIRIASTPEHQPVWFEIPVVIHRPLPRGRNDSICGVDSGTRGPYLALSADRHGRLCESALLCIGGTAQHRTRSRVAAHAGGSASGVLGRHAGLAR